MKQIGIPETKVKKAALLHIIFGDLKSEICLMDGMIGDKKMKRKMVKQ